MLTSAPEAKAPARQRQAKQLELRAKPEIPTPEHNSKDEPCQSEESEERGGADSAGGAGRWRWSGAVQVGRDPQGRQEPGIMGDREDGRRGIWA